MNREIKFRARNANLPRGWIYGYFVIQHGQCYIINDEGKHLVIAGTERQYTGLKDKNGVEIYDGDIVNFHSDHNIHTGDRDTMHIGTIGWFCSPSAWKISYKIADCHYSADVKGLTDMPEVEVIGNRTENPELIGETK